MRLFSTPSPQAKACSQAATWLLRSSLESTCHSPSANYCQQQQRGIWPRLDMVLCRRLFCSPWHAQDQLSLSVQHADVEMVQAALSARQRSCNGNGPCNHNSPGSHNNRDERPPRAPAGAPHHDPLAASHIRWTWTQLPRITPVTTLSLQSSAPDTQELPARAMGPLKTVGPPLPQLPQQTCRELPATPAV
jgi:hypothetical protein